MHDRDPLLAVVRTRFAGRGTISEGPVRVNTILIRLRSASATVFSQRGTRFRLASLRMLLALLLLAQGALPAQARLEAAALDAIAGSCGGKRVVIDRDLTRACSEFVA